MDHLRGSLAMLPGPAMIAQVNPLRNRFNCPVDQWPQDHDAANGSTGLVLSGRGLRRAN